MSTPQQANPATELMRLVAGDWAARAVFAVTALGVPDAVADGPLGAADLAARTGADAGALRRFLDYAVALRVLDGDAEGYTLGELGGPLRGGVPGSLRDYVLVAGEEFHRAWSDVLHTVRTGEPAFGHVYGDGLFGYLGTHPERAALFDSAMAGNNALFDSIRDTYDFGAHRTLVDVGGGAGELVCTVLAAHPQLRAVLVETENALLGAEKAVAEAGCAQRCELHRGDFLAELPAGGDVYVLARVLLNWSDEQGAQILANCAEAMTPGSRLLVVERVVVPGTDNSLLFAHDTLMLMLFGSGGLRTLDAVTGLLDGAGFAVQETRPLVQNFSLIVAERR